MSFKEKRKEWRKRIVHLLVLVLILTSIPIVPVQAQTEVQSVTGMEQPSTSDGDAVSVLVTENETSGEEEMVTVSEEAEITAINAEVANDTFYQEVGNIGVNGIVSSVDVILDDGTTKTCSPWDGVWNECNLAYEILDAEGNYVQQDEKYSYPVGNYICRIYVFNSDVSCEIPIEVVSLDGIAKELIVGGTISGLTGTIDYTDFDYDGCHWMKMELTELGNYKVSKTAEGTMGIVYPNGGGYNQHGTYAYINVTEENAGTYYCYVKGSDTFDVTLTKAASVASISAEVASDTFYYEIGSINEGGVVSTVMLTLDDGTTVNCGLWDQSWNDYGLSYRVLDINGNYAQQDENWKYPTGEYTFEVYLSNNDEVNCKIPVEVVSLEDEAIELSVGESITGLTGTIDYNSYDYTQGHWFKLEITEAGNYEIQKSVVGMTQVIAPDGMVSGTNGTSLCISVDDAAIGMYYFYAKGSDTFEVTIVNNPEVTGVKAEVKRNILYYEIENPFPNTVFSSVELTFDDGSVKTFEPWNAEWVNYGINAWLLDAEGNLAQQDENFKYSSGDYTYSFCTSSGEVKYEVPLKIVSLEDVATEIADGETVANLSGTENYTGYEYTDGHWLKMEVTKPGRYELSKTAEGSVLLTSTNAPGCNWNSTMLATIQASAVGTYYIYVKGSSTFDVTLTRLPEVTAMEVTVARDTFYREVEGLHDFAILESVELTIDDGTVVTCKPQDNVWVDYGITCSVLDANGNYAVWDEDSLYPVGDYVCKVYIPGSEVHCEIPIKVAPIDDVVIDITLDETITGLAGTEEYSGTTYVNGHWLRIELTEPGNYRLSKSQDGMIHVRYHSYSQGWGTWCENAKIDDIKATSAGTYYLYVRGSDTFDVTISKIPDVVSISPNVARDTFCYGLDSLYIGDAISSIELTLDDDIVTTCDLFSTTWNSYGFQYRLLDAEGNDAQRDENGNYPVGDYTYKIYTSDNTVSCMVPMKVIMLTDVEAAISEGEAISLSEAGYYKLDITETGMYEMKVTGETAGRCYARIYNEDSSVYITVSRYGEGFVCLGEMNVGTYYVKLYGYATDTDAVTLQINRKEDLVALEYFGEEIVFNYGEWGYKIEGDLSNNISTCPETPNAEFGGVYVKMPITFEGTTEGGNKIVIPYKGYQWNAYLCNIVFTNMDESTIYTDHNGYIARGEYLMHVLAYGGAVLKIPFKVVGGPMDVTTLTYTGETQEFEYGTWGYSADNMLSGNQLDEPTDANIDLNQLAKGSNVLGLEFSITGETETGEKDTISYGSKLWNQYKMKTYFYELDGASVFTDKAGYIPIGSYMMKCVAYNGVICEIPFKVYQDDGTIVEDQLGTAVNEMLDAAETLTDESLKDATTEVKKDAVTQLLENVEKIYEEQDISEIGKVIAETAIELITKLSEIEKQIENLLSTSVSVEAQDSDAEDIELSIKNALLSVPAGENAEIRVSTAEVPTDGRFDKDRAKAIELELFAKDEDKMTLRAPVVITMKVPGGINEHEKIVVHHYKDGVAVETIPVVLHGDGTMSFATGSFSTFVIANDVGGVVVNGTVSSFGDATEPVALSLVDTDGVCVAETTSMVDTGMFQFEDVEQGNYTLVVEKTNHTTREYNITVADEEVVQDVAIYLVGDVSGDGKINAKDKRMIYNHIAGESVLEDYDFLVGDVSGDGKINAKDKRIIYNHIAGESLIW